MGDDQIVAAWRWFPRQEVSPQKRNPTGSLTDPPSCELQHLFTVIDAIDFDGAIDPEQFL